MHRIHLELDIATIVVELAHGLQIGIELVFGIDVGLGVPRHPVAGVQLHFVFQRGIAERLIAHEANILDARLVAFIDREQNIDTVAINGGNGRRDFRAVKAPILILSQQLLDGACFNRLVVRATRTHAQTRQGSHQGFLVDVLAGLDIHAIDGRALLHHHDHIAAAHVNTHVLKQPQIEQCADSRRALLVVVGVAHLHGDGRKNGASIYPLQAFNLDVFDHERLGCQRDIGGQHHAGGNDQWLQ